MSKVLRTCRPEYSILKQPVEAVGLAKPDARAARARAVLNAIRKLDPSHQTMFGPVGRLYRPPDDDLAKARAHPVVMLK
jgi:hypothetical protein